MIGDTKSLVEVGVMKSVKEKNAGLFNTSLGTKTEIYKKELFEAIGAAP